MELSKYTLFSNFATSGSIYNTPFYPTEGAKSVRFWFEGPYKGGVGSSGFIAIDHAMYEGGVTQPLTTVRLVGAGGSSAYLTSTQTGVFTLASGVLHSFIAFYLDPQFMPNCIQVRYEISGVAGSASTGTMTAFMSIARDTEF